MDRREMKVKWRAASEAARELCARACRYFLETAWGSFRRDPGAVFEVALNVAVVLALVITVTL